MSMKWLGLIPICLSGVTFWAIFFKLAPWIASMVPAGDWSKLLRVLIYVIVGYFGGIGIPIALFILGIYWMMEMK